MKRSLMNLMSISLLFLASCRDTQEATTSETNSVENNLTSESENPETNAVKKTTVIGNLEIAAEDNPEQLAWFKSSEACKALGDGWRLPTIEEMQLLYDNRELIGGFDDWGTYWSSTTNEDEPTEAWTVSFHDGLQYNQNKSAYNYCFRAVRDK